MPPNVFAIELAGVVRIGHRRIVHEHHQRLALQIGAFVVVPVELGGDDTVADEDQLGVLDARRRRHVLRPRHHVVFPLQRLLLRAFLEHERRRRRRDADERHVLEIRPVSVARLQAGFLELIGQVGHRQLFALRAGRAAFELIRRQRFRVREQRVQIDRRQLADREVRGCRRRRRIGGRGAGTTRHGTDTAGARARGRQQEKKEVEREG